MKIISLVAVAFAIAVVGLLALASTRPDSIRVTRSIVIKAPPEKIFAIVSDFHRWVEWSPYEKLDPAMQRTIGGAAAGTGAVYEWSGSGKAGAGRMEILSTTPASKITIKLDFLKPFEGHNTAEYTFEPGADGVRVTWAMFGPATLLPKVMGIFVDMDKMIGTDFEAGLANLKALAEKP